MNFHQYLEFIKGASDKVVVISSVIAWLLIYAGCEVAFIHIHKYPRYLLPAHESNFLYLASFPTGFLALMTWWKSMLYAAHLSSFTIFAHLKVVLFPNPATTFSHDMTHNLCKAMSSALSDLIHDLCRAMASTLSLYLAVASLSPFIQWALQVWCLFWTVSQEFSLPPNALLRWNLRPFLAQVYVQSKEQPHNSDVLAYQAADDKNPR
jgi:hypothetical protein